MDSYGPPQPQQLPKESYGPPTQAAIIHKHVYVHVAPPETIEYDAPRWVVLIKIYHCFHFRLPKLLIIGPTYNTKNIDKHMIDFFNLD